MPLLRSGRDRIAGLVVGTETCHWGTSGATIWVGTDTGAHDASSTWPLTSGETSTMESGYPQAGASANIFEHRCVFSTAQANFPWGSWFLHTATASGGGVPLNHAAAADLGTKTSAQSWQITTCVTMTT